MAEAESPKRLPPYAPFKSFMKFMDGLKAGFVPPRLDSSYMSAQKFSGSVAGQVLTALRFLGLVSGAEPTETLRTWAKQSSDDWNKTFEKIIRTSYAPMFEIDLETATDQMFRERFRKVYGVEGEVASKIITFFTKACNEAGIQLSPLIAKRSPAGIARKPRSRKPEAAAAGARVVESEPAEPTPTAPPSSSAELEWAKFRLLVDKFPRFDPAWPDDLKAKWFAAYEKFMAANLGGLE